MNHGWRIRAALAGGPLLFLCLAALAAACGPRGVRTGPRKFALDSSGRQSIDTTALVSFAMDSTGVTTSGPCRRSVHSLQDSAHTVDPSLREYLERNDYCNWIIPEDDDEQRLRLGSADYGPMAHVFASPWTSNYRDPNAFLTYWVNVAIISIDTTPGVVLQAEYRRLHLVGGFNCVFVNYDPATTPQWTATVIQSPSGNCVPSITAASAPLLDVQVQAPSADANDYPPVARFVEGVGSTTYVGVRCGNAWCVIGAHLATDVPPPPHSGVAGGGTSKQWRVPGWADDQHLAVAEPGKPTALHPGPVASIIPVDNLDRLTLTDFTNDWQMVATVYMPNPTDKYSRPSSATSSGYGLQNGWNKLWIRAFALGTQWKARFGPNPNAPGIQTHTVIRADHSWAGFPVPGTARWRWLNTDESMWTACMIGCCTVQPNSIQ